MKRVILTIALLFISITNVDAIPININSENALLYNLTDNNIIYSKNGDKQTPIASLTKIMTAIIAIEYIDNLEDYVYINQGDLNGLLEANASVAGFNLFEKVTYRDLLYGLMLPSGADAALALVHNTYKSEKLFLEKMNELSANLSLKNTNFTTTTGLDTEGNYSTLNELVVLLKYAIKNPTFYEIFTTYDYTTSNKRLEFTNTFKKISEKVALKMNYVVGAKTGTTDDAGLCLITLAKKDNKEYILVTTRAPMSYTSPYNVYDANTIYNYFFENYQFLPIFNKDDIVINLEIKDGLTKNIDIKAQEKIELYVPQNINIDNLVYRYNSIEDITYKTRVGTLVGKLDIIYNNEILKILDISLNEKIHYNYFKILFLLMIIILSTILIRFTKFKKTKNKKMKKIYNKR